MSSIKMEYEGLFSNATCRRGSKSQCLSRRCFGQEPPPPGARDKFGGPAMQQPPDVVPLMHEIRYKFTLWILAGTKEGPSAEGNCRCIR